MKSPGEQSQQEGQSPTQLKPPGHREVDDLLLQAKDIATKIRNSISFMRKDGVQSAEPHGESFYWYL